MISSVSANQSALDGLQRAQQASAHNLANALTDPSLVRFYKTLWGTEAKHGNQFFEMALEYFDEDTVYDRAYELAAHEAEIVRTLPWRASLH